MRQKINSTIKNKRKTTYWCFQVAISHAAAVLHSGLRHRLIVDSVLSETTNMLRGLAVTTQNYTLQYKQKKINAYVYIF